MSSNIEPGRFQISSFRFQLPENKDDILKLEEWKMLDVQGRFEIDKSNGVSDQHLGWLYSSDDGKQRNRILMSDKILEGSIGTLPLSKPLYCLQKQSDGKYKIVSVIKEKTTFYERPQIINKTQYEEELVKGEFLLGTNNDNDNDNIEFREKNKIKKEISN